MSVVVDPNAPDTMGDRARAVWKNWHIHLYSAIYAALLGIVAWGAEPWFVNIVYTLSWIGLAFIFLATLFMGLAWGVFAVKGEEIASQGSAESRRSLSNMSKHLRPRASMWVSRLLTAIQVVLLYYVGFTAIGVMYLILSLLSMMFIWGLRTKCKELMMFKLSAE